VDLESQIMMTFGYIDPSTGGQLFQLLAVVFTAVSGGLFFFSRQLRMSAARARRLVKERLLRR
jgi:hypothetical protein